MATEPILRGYRRAVTLTQSLLCALLPVSQPRVVQGAVVWHGQLRGGIERSAPLRESVHLLTSTAIKSHELMPHVQDWVAPLLNTVHDSLHYLQQVVWSARSTGTNAKDPGQSDSSADVFKPTLIFVFVVCVLVTTWTLTRRLRSAVSLSAGLSHAPALSICQLTDTGRAGGFVRYLTTEMQPARMMRRLHRRTGSKIA